MAKAKTNPQFIETAVRRNHVLALRKAGKTYRAIADNMVNYYELGQLPRNYDERYAYADVMAELKKLNDERMEGASEVQRLELERMDKLWEKQYEMAVTGNQGAVDRCLRIMDRRAKLLGLDAPTRSELSGPDGGPLYVVSWDDDDQNNTG